MAATISFRTNNLAINDSAGSGLGFFGDSGFGASVSVGSYQGRTFIASSDGTTAGAEGCNIKYLNTGSGIIGQTGSGTALLAIPNYLASLNIRANFDTAVQTQNALVYFYDRVSPNNNPSGVTVKCAELIHPDVLQTSSGSGDSTWLTPAGSGVTVSLCPCPGPSGIFAGNGSNSAYSNSQHDWFLATSVSPNSIGAKTFGLYVSLEYL